jgi:C-terminal processing protease CtpA/Prc
MVWIRKINRACALLAAFAAIGCLSLWAQTAAKPPLDDSSWNLFQRVFGMVLRDYVEPKTADDVILGALKGAASSAGPECAYIPPDESAAYRRLATPSAVLPLYVTKDADFAQVLAVYPDHGDTIKPGDSLRFIGDRSTYDMTYPQVLEALRGKAGDKVRCIFLKESAWQSYEVTLEYQKPAPPVWMALPSGAACLAIPCLEAEPSSQILQNLKAINGPLLIDLRGCASGEVSDALRWAGLLLGKGDAPSKKGPRGITTQPLSGPGYIARRAFRVLVDRTTARGGEVLALALSGAGGVLVGQPTLGWAPYPEDLPLENGGILRLNTAYFQAPDGSPMKDHPITPDIPFETKADQKLGDVYSRALTAAPEKSAAKDGDHGRK